MKAIVHSTAEPSLNGRPYKGRHNRIHLHIQDRFNDSYNVEVHVFTIHFEPPDNLFIKDKMPVPKYVYGGLTLVLSFHMCHSSR